MPLSAAPRPPHAVSGTDRGRILAIMAASSGNLVEWFDFYIYAFTSIYFAAAFFPQGDQTAQWLKTSAVFAVGFFMRPIGGWIFGRIADRRGRRTSLLSSVLTMCIGSMLIALLPTHAQVGAWAPLLLLLARLLQGISVGGEYGATATYMSEVALAGRRGFYSSFQYVTLIGGQLLASLVIFLMLRGLSSAEMRAGWWRLPFVIGALLALLSMLWRRTLQETASERTRSQAEAGSFAHIWRHHRRAFVTVLGYTSGGSLIFYTFTTYMQKYLIATTGLPDRAASTVTLVTLFLYMCMQPAFGALSDRIGRRRSMTTFGLLGALATVPLMTAIGHAASPLAAGALITAALAIVSLYTSVAGIVKAELFPAPVRALGVGVGYAISNALFGGSAEYVALQLKDWHLESVFFWYVSAMMLVALAASLQLPRAPAYLRTDD